MFATICVAVRTRGSAARNQSFGGTPLLQDTTSMFCEEPSTLHHRTGAPSTIDTRPKGPQRPHPPRPRSTYSSHARRLPHATRHFDVQWTGAKAKPIDLIRTYELLEEANRASVGARAPGARRSSEPRGSTGRLPSPAKNRKVDDLLTYNMYNWLYM